MAPQVALNDLGPHVDRRRRPEGNEAGVGRVRNREAEHRAIGHREDNQIALIGDGRVDQRVAVTFPTRRVKPIRRASTRPRVLIGLAARRYASL
jgi:hypothetical protein